jgi:hypothetical protein
MIRFLPFLALILAIGIFFAYIHPTYVNTIEPLQAEIKSDNDALAGAEKFHDKENELTQEQKAIPQDQLERLEKFLPNGVDNVQLILDLDALAARSGIQLSNFDVKQSSDAQSTTTSSFSVLSQNAGSGAGTGSLDLSMNATGTYSAFRKFLSGIEHSLRPLDVIELTVSNTAVPGVYNYAMTIRLYWLH